jgi:hypothetical protein
MRKVKFEWGLVEEVPGRAERFIKFARIYLARQVCACRPHKSSKNCKGWPLKEGRIVIIHPIT